MCLTLRAPVGRANSFLTNLSLEARGTCLITPAPCLHRVLDVLRARLADLNEDGGDRPSAARTAAESLYGRIYSVSGTPILIQVR